MKTRHISSTIFITIGFILSPLSWWNDLLINLPLAYALSYPISLINDSLFLPGFILAYWFTNLLGLIMLHWGSEQLLGLNRIGFSMKRSIIVSLAYSVVMIIIVLLGWLSPPTDYL